MDWKKTLFNFVTTYKGKTIGALIGLAFGAVTINFGFWKALFLTICIYIGYFIGNEIEENGDLTSLIDRVWKNR